ncbi:MAG: helix-turn-helix domain-containing protein [Colwellia sp.]|nr:helix-turn-helix domain-containing protein [Colwellia sp.]
MAVLCKVADLSERSLEYGFQEYLGITPIQYLRVLRLNGARLDFLSNINSRTKVSDIALTWGFLEFGRFANNYRQLFQERPSVTLKTMM